MPDARKLILKNHLSPGDVLCMTAAMRSLHQQYPGKYLTAVDTSAPAIFEHSPDVVPLDEAKAAGFEEVVTEYPLVHRSNQDPHNVLHGYCDFLQRRLGIPLPLMGNRPVIWLSPEERAWQNQVHQETGKDRKFWLINAGSKQDFTAKQYHAYEEVVDRLQGRVLFVQVGSAEHLHKPLEGVIDFIGKTDMRQLIRLVYHAQGVVCGVTFLMHLAAAFEKPAVVIAGGREPRSWNTFPRQVLLSTVGMLPCCKDGGCWRSRVVKLGDGSEQDGSLCDNPMPTTPAAGKCMGLISPESVADAVMGYYAGGVLTH